MSEQDSEIKGVYSALKESESRLNAIIESAVDGIITIDRKGIIQSFNRAGLELFQYTEEEVLGKNINILMPEPDHSQHDGYIENYKRTGEKKIIGIGRQVKGLKKDGTQFPFRLSVSEVVLDSGTLFMGIVHDMTEQVRAEEELRILNESLEEQVNERTSQLNEAIANLRKTNGSLNQEVSKRKKTEAEIKALLEKEIELGALKSRFVSMASHEFRTPLSGILSSASLISKYTDEEGNEKRIKHIDRIKSSVQNLTNILNDFLSLDKLQSGKVSLHPSEFSIHELVTEIQEEMQGLISDDRSIAYTHSGDEVTIHIDRNIMKNVLLNLVSNAIKYSNPGTVIKIRTGILSKQLNLEVEDSGIGIPKADQKHMFERFFRAQNATNIKGTGLGLNIVRRYLDLLGGTIDFKSIEGVGTTFIVSTPIKSI